MEIKLKFPLGWERNKIQTSDESKIRILDAFETGLFKTEVLFEPYQTSMCCGTTRGIE